MSTLTTSSIKKVGATYVSEKRLYVDEKRERIVAETDPKVGFLLCPAGGTLSEAEVRKYGLLTAASPSGETIVNRETRVPKNLATR